MSGLSLELSAELVETLAQRVGAIVLERVEQSYRRQWFTIEDAAEYIGRTPEAIRGLLKRGELTAYKPDGRVQLNRDDLDRWMRGGE